MIPFLIVRRVSPVVKFTLNYSVPVGWRSLSNRMLTTEVDLTTKPAERKPFSSFEERRIGFSAKEQKKLKRAHVSPEDSRILKVAIIGAPNAGKSTLANQLIGWKFAPVSQKVHTTRNKTLGVLTEENKQVIFLDTPGIVVPRKVKQHKLENTLLVDPHLAVFEADLIAVVVDVSHVWHRAQLDAEVQKILHVHADKQSILILNKVDSVQNKQELLGVARTLTAGIVAGTKSWSTEKQSKKINLDKLFAKMKLHKKGSTKIDNDKKHQSISAENEYSEAKEASDATTTNLETVCDSDLTKSGKYSHTERESDFSHNRDVYKYGETDGTTVTVSEGADIQDTSDDVSEDSMAEADSSNQTAVLPRLHFDGIPDLKDPVVWKSYYRHLQSLGKTIADKSGWPNFDEVFMISALSGDGVYELKQFLLDETYSSPLHYHPSLVTDQNPLTLARLCIFERLLDHLPNEIPYEIKVELTLWEITEDNLLRASFDLICNRKRHLHYVFGKDGQTIRAIAAEAKQQLMNAFRREMSLQLAVKARGDIYKKK